MHDLPDTRHTLVLRLRDRADQQAWGEFVRVYEPAVYRTARRRGLQHADALDLTQEVLAAVAGAIDRWEPDASRGRFRAWLFTVARNLTTNAISRGDRQRGSGDTGVMNRLHEQPSQGDPITTEFELEYRRQAFAEAERIVRAGINESTWQAFYLTTIDVMCAEEAARRLQLSVGSVYAARSRVLARLRRAVESLEGK